jgi:multiple antibiotic resistance protein
VDLYSAALTLFLVMDPLGNVPVFLSVLQDVPPERRRRVILREMLIALVVMLGVLLAGGQLLKALQLDQVTISISGGIVLFLIALRMVFPGEGGVAGGERGAEPFIVPLAIPLVAGPSTLAALLLLARSAPGRLPEWIAALSLAWVVTAAILWASGLFFRVLGRRGLQALERLMGMLLVMVAVQMFLNGLKEYLR